MRSRLNNMQSRFRKSNQANESKNEPELTKLQQLLEHN
jgi:hypothetical protein